jgi:hypothetical protein
MSNWTEFHDRVTLGQGDGIEWEVGRGKGDEVRRNWGRGGGNRKRGVGVKIL